MGQAVELPDPLEQPNATAAAASSADDLLAQLASDEIDRLLVEADSDAGPKMPAIAPLDLPPEVTTVPALDAVAPAEAPVAVLAAVEPDVAPSVVAAEPTVVAAAPEPEAHADTASPEERSELLSIKPLSSERVPWYIKPLDWLTPDVSDRTREAIGKAAIATLVMAATIILYTLSTRKH